MRTLRLVIPIILLYSLISCASGPSRSSHRNLKARSLGTQFVQGYPIKITQYGPVIAGNKLILEFYIEKGFEPIKEIWFWVGTSKQRHYEYYTKIVERPKFRRTYRVTLRVPNPIPRGVQLWLKVHSSTLNGQNPFYLAE